MKKNIAIMVLAAAVVAGGVWVLRGDAGAEQLTTVAVVDLEQVALSFFSESQAYRALLDRAEEITLELELEQEEIDEIQRDLIEARDRGSRTRELQLERELQDRRVFFEDLRQLRQRELERLREDLTSDEFVAELNTAVEFVSSNSGYTVVFNMQEDNILWWSQEVDITDPVIDRLRATSGF